MLLPNGFNALHDEVADGAGDPNLTDRQREVLGALTEEQWEALSAPADREWADHWYAVLDGWRRTVIDTAITELKLDNDTDRPGERLCGCGARHDVHPDDDEETS